MEHALRPVTVVGQQQQAFRVAVEAADGEEPRGAFARSSRRTRSMTVRSAWRSLTVLVTPAGLARAGRRRSAGTGDRAAVDGEHVSCRIDELADAGR